jgi:serine/threonine protein kinase
MENYVIIEKEGKNSGEGTYGVVYKAKDKRTGGFVVLKVSKSIFAYSQMLWHNLLDVVH